MTALRQTPTTRSTFIILPFILFFLLFMSASQTTGAEPANKFFYDEKGRVIREEIDTGSGRIDTWVTYREGRAVLQAVDTDKDGKPDAWYHLASNRQVEKAGERQQRRRQARCLDGLSAGRAD
ncbi:MAG: hypothetical protein M5R38_07465 [Candidatus Methylomirabilis sp.]|nr:hypothetical protein [Candidatus Methylomirabilis sp.]